MSPILGTAEAFLAQTRKDLFKALFPGCSRGYELTSGGGGGGGGALTIQERFFGLFFLHRVSSVFSFSAPFRRCAGVHVNGARKKKTPHQTRSLR